MANNIPDNISMEYAPCPMGCKEGDVVVMKGQDLLHGFPGKFTIVRCRSCGLMRTNPRPDPGSMGFYYPDNYGPFLGSKIEDDNDKDSSWLKNKIKHIVNSLFEMNGKRIPDLETGRLLEVGCASGAYLHSMAKKGWEVQGIEVDSYSANNARSHGYDVFNGTIEEAPTPNQLFDLVTAFMVLEHLHEPVLALEKIYEWTKSDGWLVFSVPNAASIERRIFKDKWYALQLPTHTYHYTPDSISKLLEKSGWTLDTVFYQRNLNNFFCSLGLVLKSKGYQNKLSKWLLSYPQKSRFYNLSLFPIGLILSFFKQSGRMTIWARKK